MPTHPASVESTICHHIAARNHVAYFHQWALIVYWCSGWNEYINQIINIHHHFTCMCLSVMHPHHNAACVYIVHYATGVPPALRSQNPLLLHVRYRYRPTISPARRQALPGVACWNPSVHSWHHHAPEMESAEAATDTICAGCHIHILDTIWCG